MTNRSAAAMELRRDEADDDADDKDDDDFDVNTRAVAKKLTDPPM